MRCKSWDFLFYNDPEMAGMCLTTQKMPLVCLMLVFWLGESYCWTSEYEFIKNIVFILKIVEKLQKIRAELP